MEIEWLTPSGAPAPLSGPGSVEDTVSHLTAVKAAVYGQAVGLGREASMALLHHRHKGRAHIEVGRHPHAKLNSPDWYVYLRDADPGGEGIGGENKFDRSAMSIEFGWTAKNGRHVDGLNILGGVIARAAARHRGVL